MVASSNSSGTHRLLDRARTNDRQALQDLFGRFRERLRLMVRLRMDRRLRARINSSSVLELVYRDLCERISEYSAQSSLPFFLWLRQLTGQRIQALHRQYLGGETWGAGQEISLYQGALPEASAVILASQLLGQRNASQGTPLAKLQIRLQDALNSMDPLDREILALCHCERLRNDEAAISLGIDSASAGRRYLQAIKRLKEVLQGVPGFF